MSCGPKNPSRDLVAEGQDYDEYRLSKVIFAQVPQRMDAYCQVIQAAIHMATAMVQFKDGAMHASYDLQSFIALDDAVNAWIDAIVANFSGIARLEFGWANEDENDDSPMDHRISLSFVLEEGLSHVSVYITIRKSRAREGRVNYLIARHWQ